MINPKTPSAYGGDFKAVDSIDAVDAYTVHVRYKHPNAKALQSWSIWMLPKHLLETAAREGKRREAPQNRTKPVGTGPYLFKEWKSGEKVVLVANPSYFEGRPYISRVVYRIIPSSATTFLELKAKGVDGAKLTELQFKRQTEYPAFRKAYVKSQYAASVYVYLGMNLRDPRFADRRVRQAFAHAINKREIIDGVRLGLAREATGPYKPGTWQYNPNAHQYPYDPAKAASLLAEAGWNTKNADGILMKNGVPFKFDILVAQGGEEGRKVSEIIQVSMMDIGIEYELLGIE